MARVLIYTAQAVLVLLVCRTAVFADDRIEVLQLRQRPAAQVIPLIRPLLHPDEAVSGTGFQLILRARPQTIAEVRKLLERIDAGLKNLMILVTHEDMSNRRRGAVGADIRYNSEYGGAASVRAHQVEETEAVNIAQRIRVIEGNPARLHAGTAQINPYLYGPSRHDVGSGVMVVPRLNGEQVNLEIQPYHERLRVGRDRLWPGAPREADVQRLSTVVSGRLGEWIFIGGVSQSAQGGSQRILSRAQSYDTGQSGVWVKVLVVD